jgi:hypothetical protein
MYGAGIGGIQDQDAIEKLCKKGILCVASQLGKEE